MGQPRVRLQVEKRRGGEELASHTHHCCQREDALQVDWTINWVSFGWSLIFIPCHRLAQQKEFQAQKYFSIDRVFRNETLDATHLAEFHQIEVSFQIVIQNFALKKSQKLASIQNMI